MIYRVRGTNRDTNAPMALDIDAADPAAAQVVAAARGMVVQSVDDVTAEAVARPTSLHRGEGPDPGSTPDSGGTRNLIVFAVLLVAIAVIGYFTLPIVLQKNVVSPPPTTAPAY